MAYPSFINAGSIVADTAGAGSVTPTLPTHQADDILIIVAGNAGGTPVSTGTSGWTQIDNGTNYIGIFWKRATGAGTAGATIVSSTTDLFAIGYVFRGCRTTGDPFDNFTTLADVSNTIASDGAGVLTEGAERLAVVFYAVGDDTAFTPNNTIWDEVVSEVTTTTGTDVAFRVATKQFAASGAEIGDVVLGTLAAVEGWRTFMIDLAPPAVTAQPKNYGFIIG